MYPKKLGRVYYVYHRYDAKKDLATPVLEVRHITKILNGCVFHLFNKKNKTETIHNSFESGLFLNRSEAINYYNRFIDESIKRYHEKEKELGNRVLVIRQHIATLKYY